MTAPGDEHRAADMIPLSPLVPEDALMPGFQDGGIAAAGSEGGVPGVEFPFRPPREADAAEGDAGPWRGGGYVSVLQFRLPVTPSVMTYSASFMLRTSRFRSACS